MGEKCQHFANEKDTALIILNQSKAYEIVDHTILLQKLEIVGFQPQEIRIMKSSIDKKQLVQIEDRRSEPLLTGPVSVAQGSTLSCAFFLLYILDLSDMFHQENHDPLQYRNCDHTGAKTFEDDAYLMAV